MCLNHVGIICLCVLVEKGGFLTQEKGFLSITLATTMRGRFVESGKVLKAQRDCSDNLERHLECQRSKNPISSLVAFQQLVET